MASWIKKNIISVTRADSLWTKLTLNDANGELYVPDPNDQIWFALKEDTDDSKTPLVMKRINPTTLELRLDPQDTDFPPGEYKYDVEVRLNNGFVDTVIAAQKFKITPQVKNVNAG